VSHSYWQRGRLDFGGGPYDRRDIYDEHSPITFVRACRTPTLLLYGQHDTAVPPSQGQEFHAALLEQQVPTELVIYPREGHFIMEARHQMDLQERVLAWFDRFLK